MVYGLKAGLNYFFDMFGGVYLISLNYVLGSSMNPFLDVT